MLRPSYSDLMEVLSEQDNIDDSIVSRYTIVIAAARRARMLIDGAPSYVEGEKDKAVTQAVQEMFDGHVKITEGKIKKKSKKDMVLVEETFTRDYNK